MNSKRTRTSAVAILLAGVAVFSLAGCETIEKETGMSKSTQTGALGGAAFGGIIAALAGANPAWIAASTILGGVTGGVIGDYLGKDDAEKHASNNLNALDTLGQGQSSSWSSADGDHGSTKIDKVTTMADGTVCKTYTESVHTAKKSVTQTATACKKPGGTWLVQT